MTSLKKLKKPVSTGRKSDTGDDKSNSSIFDPMEDEFGEIDEDIYQQNSNDVSRFLSYDDRYILRFNHYEFKLFLEANGFYKYKLSTGYAIIRIINNLVRLVEPYEIKDFVLNHINDEKKKNYIIEKAKIIFDSDRLDFLNIYTGEFHSDTAT